MMQWAMVMVVVHQQKTLRLRHTLLILLRRKEMMTTDYDDNDDEEGNHEIALSPIDRYKAIYNRAGITLGPIFSEASCDRSENFAFIYRS